MKIPTYITARFPVSLTHGFSSNFGSVNVSMTIQLDRAKYLNGDSIIDSIGDSVLPDFKSSIESHTQEIN
jgi:hypothetical protein